MVVLKQVRTIRAASVPVEPIRLIDLQASEAARRISVAARDDTDELMKASKRHDRQMLSDINAKLANQSLLQRPPMSTKRSSATTTTNLRRPPLPPNGTRTVTTTVHSTTPTIHRRILHNLEDSADDVYIPSTPVTRSVIRAASLPPQLPPPAVTTSYYLSSGGLPVYTPVYAPSHEHHTFSPLTYAEAKLGGSELNGVADVDSTYIQNGWDKYGGYVPTRVTGPPARLTPVTDLAIKQAHRNLDRIERELKYNPADGSDRYKYVPKSYVTVQPAEVVTVRRSFGPTVTSIGAAVPVSSVRVRAVSLSPARSLPGSAANGYRTPHLSPSRPVRRTSPVRPSELIALASPSITQSEISAKVTSKLLSPDSELLKTYHSIPSRYSLPPSVVTAHKTPVIRHSDINTLSHQPAPVSSGRPKMSETRRKVRDVLCKVKKDPHYFD